MKPGTLFPHKGRQIGNLLDIYFADWSGVRAAGGITVAGTTRPISGAAVVVNGLAVNFAQLPNLARVEFGRAAGIAGAVPGAAAKAEAYLKFFIYLAFHAIGCRRGRPCAVRTSSTYANAGSRSPHSNCNAL